MPANVSPIADDATLTLDMVHQFAYCPRRFHLMYVEGRWADNVYTVEGRHVHRRVDAIDHVLPDADAPGPAPGSEESDDDKNVVTDKGDEPPTISRSVPLASETLGLTAKLDLVSTDGQEAAPVDTKRGRVPNTPERSYEPERVQLMAQGLLLREHDYRCDHGILYFAGSRTRVTVPFTPELETRTLSLIEQTHQAAERRDLPQPLDDSPKCRGCSLNGICLPDETLALQQVPETAISSAEPAEKLPGPGVRRLYPARDDASPLYVQDQGAYVGKSGQRLVVRKEGQELSSVRLIDLSQLVLCGNIGISAQTIHLLCEAGIPIVHLSMGHWFYGVTHGITLRNAFDRAAQFDAARNPARCLEFAKQLVTDKAANQRTLIRRNAVSSKELDMALRDIDDLIARIPQITSLESLLGIEGGIAAKYFGRFADMLKPRSMDTQWDFNQRNRRPPRDPVNALLSFVYALLVKECTVALLSEGLDPWWGFYHQPRHGRPALSLDIMEPLRPVVADSVVITAINTGMVSSRNFEQSAAGCMLRDAGRKAILRAFEARLDQLVTHPVFDYRCSWRSIIKVQARLLSRWLRGDIHRYENVVTR
ncbi:MAG: CRISPR-associated endonuclease Cas4g/Cas1g [Phycisphaerales bacterium]